MTDNPAEPLLGDQDRDEASATDNVNESRTPTAPSRDSRPTSKQSRRSERSDETTPLLSRGDDDDDDDSPRGRAARSLHNLQDSDSPQKKKRIRWPIFIALAVLCSVVILIMVFAFATPEIVREYAEQAVVFEPTNLSIDSFTATGVNARVQGQFRVDGSRVQKKPVRDLGRFGSWIARAVESRQTTVKVYLPQYDNLLLGTADVPPITVSVRDGEITPIDFTAEVAPGDFNGIRQIANDWLEGRLGSLVVQGKADVGIKSGIFSFGTQHLAHQLTFAGDSIPDMPKYRILKALVHEIEVDGEKAMAADVAIKAYNNYPVSFHIPGMAFDILIPGCPAVGDLIMLANATTKEFDVKPEHYLVARAQGVVREIPKLLIERCPGTNDSPLDTILKDYMRGSPATVFVRGSHSAHEGVPEWVHDFLKDVVVPVSIPGKSLGGLIRNFTMDKTHFSLPDPMADPETPEGSPRVSATVKVIANLPKQMNFPVSIDRIRSNATVYYKGKELGLLDLHKWQPANSSRIEAHDGVPAGLAIDSEIKDAPLNITDSDVFTEVIQAMLFGGKGLILDIKAQVDVRTHTALGEFTVRGIPAEGRVPIKPPGAGNGTGLDLKALAPKIYGLEIAETTPESITLEAKVNITNPTKYSATVPYVDINILVNNTILGHATARNLELHPGNNTDLSVSAVWDPTSFGGEHAHKVARNFISQYISGYNTTISVRVHKNTIPTLPQLGRALSNITLDVPTPRLKPPKNPNHDPEDPDDDGSDGPHFIQDTTMHLLSSTATFTLLSPLKKSTLYLTHINATALYNHSEPVGFILYDVPFAVPPGASETPRLPVEWDLLSVGYEAIKEALGGKLKLDATAEVSVRLGQWEETIWFKGKGIGAKVRA